MPDSEGRIRPVQIPRVPWHEQEEKRPRISLAPLGLDQPNRGLAGAGSDDVLASPQSKEAAEATSKPNAGDEPASS